MSRIIAYLAVGILAFGCTDDSILLGQLAALSGAVQLDGEATQLVIPACCPPEGAESEAGTIQLDPVMSAPVGFVAVPLSYHGVRILDVAGPVRFEIRTAESATFVPVVGTTVYALPATLRVIVTGCADAARFRIVVAAVYGEVEGELNPASLLDLDNVVIWEGAETVTVAIDNCTSVARPQVALDGGGNGTIVYEQDGAIVAERYVGDVFEEPRVIDPGPGASAPDVAMDGDGGAIAVWLRDVDGRRAVYGSVFRKDAGAWSPPVALDPATEDDGPDLGDGAQPEAPQVSLARDGTGLVAWARGGAIIGRRVESLFFLVTEFVIERDDVAFRRPRAAVNADGSIGMLVWESDLNFVFTVDAPPLGEFSLITQFGEAGVSGLHLAIAGAVAAVVYEDADGVIARRFGDGAWGPPERVAVGSAPRVAVAADGGVHVSFSGVGGVFVSEHDGDAFEFPRSIAPAGTRSAIAMHDDIAYVLASGGEMNAARYGLARWAETRSIGGGPAAESDIAMDASGTSIAAWVSDGVLRRFVWALPVASFTHDAAVAGQPVTLNAAGSYARTTGGAIASYFWTFGDEDHESGAAVERTFTQSQSVELTVTDDWGNRATVEQVAEVESGSDTVTLTIEFAGGGTGEVFLGAPQTTCTQTCTIQVPRGAALFLQPRPTGASVFSHWTGCDNDVGIEGCGITMNEDRTVQVFFE